MRQRDRKKPRSARSQVSPRTVTSVTTHSVTTHNKEEQTVRILLDPSYITLPFISTPFDLHQTHSLPEQGRNSVTGSSNKGTGRESDYKCHHAQQRRTNSENPSGPINSENPSGPILHHPAIHPHSFISTRHTVYRN